MNSDTIKRLREHLGIRQFEFAEMLGVNRPFMSEIESGRRAVPEKIKERILELIENTEYEYLLKDQESEDIKKRIYLLPSKAMGGSLTGIGIDGITPDQCETIISPVVGADFAITVYGDSMAPQYPSGSRVIIKKINPDTFIEWGKVYVLDTTNGILVKEVHKAERDTHIGCFSVNPDPKFASFEVPRAEIKGWYLVLMLDCKKCLQLIWEGTHLRRGLYPKALRSSKFRRGSGTQK